MLDCFLRPSSGPTRMRSRTKREVEDARACAQGGTSRDVTTYVVFSSALHSSISSKKNNDFPSFELLNFSCLVSAALNTKLFV
jgi:hypothetical protein